MLMDNNRNTPKSAIRKGQLREIVKVRSERPEKFPVKTAWQKGKAKSSNDWKDLQKT